MNELLNQVTPLTRGIIWLTTELQSENPHYAGIDYLLDGLLTANLQASKNLSSRVIIGQNFNHPLYVMVIKEIKSAEIQSFLSLLKNYLGPENDVIVINELENSGNLKAELKSILSHLKGM